MPQRVLVKLLLLLCAAAAAATPTSSWAASIKLFSLAGPVTGNVGGRTGSGGDPACALAASGRGWTCSTAFMVLPMPLDDTTAYNRSRIWTSPTPSPTPIPSVWDVVGPSGTPVASTWGSLFTAPLINSMGDASVVPTPSDVFWTGLSTSILPETSNSCASPTVAPFSTSNSAYTGRLGNTTTTALSTPWFSSSAVRTCDLTAYVLCACLPPPTASPSAQPSRAPTSSKPTRAPSRAPSRAPTCQYASTCPLGMRAVSQLGGCYQCTLCPAFGYEPLTDSNPLQCANLPCASGYWCGAGAAESSGAPSRLTYRRSISVAPTLTIVVVVGQIGAQPLAITNVDAVAGVTLELMQPPSGIPGPLTVTELPQKSSVYAVAPGSVGSLTVQVDGAQLDASTLSYTFVLPLRWRIQGEALNFSTNATITVNQVTAIVTPTDFSYTCLLYTSDAADD